MIQQDEADNKPEVSHYICYSSLPTSQYLWLLQQLQGFPSKCVCYISKHVFSGEVYGISQSDSAITVPSNLGRILK